MIQFIYNLILTLLQFIILKFSIPSKSKKFQSWKKGQKIIWSEIKPTTQNSIWFHISSSGEFEQAKPLIEFLRKQGFQIIATFFSPSGYEELNNNPLLNKVYYLPIDTQTNAQKFLQRINPIAAVFVKYDFWLNYMIELNRKKIPTFVISGVFPKNHFMFSLFGKAHLKQLKLFNYISVQDQHSFENLKKFNIQSEITGDTRIDRSIELPNEHFEDLKIKQFIQNSKTTIIIGSSWEKDLEQFEQIYPNLKRIGIQLIIAPHELNPEKISKIQQKFSAILYTEENSNLKQFNTLIINTIGILKYIYRYATIVYIGGGFDDGIHNTLEPASYAKPIIFGKNYSKFMEANIMIENGGAFSIKNADELYQTILELTKDKNHIKAGKLAQKYLDEYRGATQKIGHKMLSTLNTIDQ